MRYSDPFGYLLTWTTYGAWLHGDPRGSIERGGPTTWPKLVAPDEALHKRMAAQMKHPPLILDAAQRSAVDEAIGEHCKVKRWTLYALHVRTNHVHVVIEPALPPSRMLNSIKAWATKGLRARGLLAADRPVWTEGGSKRWLWSREQLEHAMRYVDLHQGRKLPDA